MATVKLTSQNFNSEISKGTVLVDFWAEYCGPCRFMAPILEKISDEHPEYKIGKVDTAEERELAFSFGISAIPTLVLFKDGKEIIRNEGAIPEEAVLKLLAH
ncbi:MAG: thioredoxin [Ruminococcaceae bacterium]|nr:thioredoxin [Oscillospiraceae bacterium]